VTPEKPGEVTPEKPGEVTPEKPGKVAPEKPGKVAPEKPGKVAPEKPEATSALITEKLPQPIPPPKLVKIPKVLIGLTGGEILDIFGPPIFIRKDPPAEFWRYQSESCVLEVFLYTKNDDLRVEYVNTRPKGGAPTTLSRCIPNSQKRG
jgi:hypothetical protein